MSKEEKKYDHIIAGGGLAGLSLAYKLSLEEAYKDKRILVIDKDKKQSNDRTDYSLSISNDKRHRFL